MSATDSHRPWSLLGVIGAVAAVVAAAIVLVAAVGLALLWWAVLGAAMLAAGVAAAWWGIGNLRVQQEMEALDRRREQDVSPRQPPSTGPPPRDKAVEREREAGE